MITDKIKMPNKKSIARRLMMTPSFKPSLELPANEAVHTSTRESFNQLMKVYETSKLLWLSDFDATKMPHFWAVYKRGTCVSYERERLFFGSIEFYKEDAYSVITPSKLYKREGITATMIRKINDFFREREGELEKQAGEGAR